MKKNGVFIHYYAGKSINLSFVDSSVVLTKLSPQSVCLNNTHGRTIQTPVEHLQWSFSAKLVNG